MCFAQRQEIQQVYVRSTARVYEIYYASSLHGENEYLCTVRCSVAEREGEILLAAIEDASKQHMKVIKGGKTGSNSEEDWVDVEVPDLPVVENGNNCLLKQAAKEGGRSIQVRILKYTPFIQIGYSLLFLILFFCHCYCTCVLSVLFHFTLLISDVTP